MGWSYGPRHKGESHKDYFSKLFDHPNGKVLDAAGGFNEVYIAFQAPEGVIGIAVQVQWVPTDAWGHNFGYKAAEESMGPPIQNCPQRILELLSPLDQLYTPGSDSHTWAGKWREACWQRILARQARPTVRAGDTVKFSKTIKFTSGTEEDTFVFVKGSTFKGRHGYGRYRISNWRDSDFQVLSPAGAEGGS